VEKLKRCPECKNVLLNGSLYLDGIILQRDKECSICEFKYTEIYAVQLLHNSTDEGVNLDGKGNPIIVEEK